MATILIDNYESFTWNLYQYFCQAGAEVIVYRNDQVTLEKVIAHNPRNIVISPGPGHPREDTGICMDAIRHFAGKIPVFGVCMGLQCMFECFGGTVSSAGEIVHGKTNTVTHDGLGIYSGIPQNILETRYHSLSGDPSTLPKDFVVTSWTSNSNGDCIMGIRHRTFTVESVQYHPESILSEHGHTMIKNFLALNGGTWDENPGFCDRAPIATYKPQTQTNGTAPPSKTADSGKKDILSAIFEQRKKDVALAKSLPGKSPAQLEKLISLGLAPALMDFPSRLRQSIGRNNNSDHGGKLAVLAEVKRASPSKGDIFVDAVAAEQALKYANAGAAAISVLTEPKWFKGSLDDLQQARQAIEKLGSNRPAILRKDFIFDSYQILEARLAGADTVLLIVAMLSKDQLVELMSFSRKHGMEPLVEVNNSEEMELAIQIGAQVIGINNRNLHTFDVDMSTTTKLAHQVSNSSTILVALSGISAPEDALSYKGTNTSAVLIGEALMRSDDPKLFITQLRSFDI
ncbi:anthranilate synthase / indole-3-glycerol phosphate synthase [Mycoemilia scoparia]|uniref:Multifunctional tryptophan biosynthesis protein n=1 Tax=Mycoemilia scoparia TaxID=417184 RepID=A0A9W8DPR2_9FUNG|nr:anthranilate synthase / indole-3-glycerol phosphate synthase [Mycoemilia scoparia]